MQEPVRIGVMGSAATIPDSADGERLRRLAQTLGFSIANHGATLFTGATTGLVYEVGQAARSHGAFHIGISPGSSRQEHIERYQLPTDACNEMVYTGFGLKGRNVVLVRSCDIVLFISGGMGSLNEFTIAHDEEKVIGCLIGSGGVADNSEYLLKTFSPGKVRIVQESEPDRLVEESIRRWKTVK